MKIILECLSIVIIVTISVTNSSMYDEPDLHSHSSAINKFSNRFYSALAEHESDNLICSPLSVYVALGMASYGARGNTKKQLVSALKFPHDKTIAKREIQYLLDSLNNVRRAELKLVNKIFTTNKFELNPKFKKITKKYFGSEVKRVDFTNVEKTVKTINNLCANESNNHITDVVESSDIAGAEMVLVNAVYFKGKWAEKFNPKWTNPYPFDIDEKTTKDVPMMYNVAQFYWGHIRAVKSRFIKLPYESDEKKEAIEMIIVLPDSGVDVREVEHNIYKINFTQLEGSTMKMALHLPKFKIKSKFDLKPALQDVGITEIFEDTADFSGIIKNTKLKVSKIIQKAFIEVNEEGTEAAAVTAVMTMKHCQFLFSGIIVALSITNSLSNCVQSDEPALKAVSTAANKFSNNFYKAVADSESGNFICSPVSVDIVLSMTNFGARGNTQKQLESSLSLPCDKTVAKQGFQQLINSFNNVKGAELKLANKVFTASNSKLQSDFQEITKTYFGSESQSVDFTNTEAAAATINNWCAEKTNNRITELFKPNDVEGFLLVLVNAVYFKGKWADKFNPERTRSSPFQIDENTTKDVQMMYKMANYNWGDLDTIEAKYIELPYESKDDSEAISMFIILPDKHSGLRDVENRIHNINFSSLEGPKREVALHLPKFKIESKLDLKPILRNMGITEMFEDSADFTGIMEDTQLKVSKVFQKAFIEVNEEGTEAAAVTGMGFISISMPREFIVNRPFICAIVKTDTGTQLFNARIVDPTAS
ncbi:serpin A11-like [Microplitis mediator]|uniref:serpin A11-like n=1 Tax=Microplitis mediator TaxID=375433 RepID=UPI002556FE2F|nr:serpin A11-like [Microplitis mediator]